MSPPSRWASFIEVGLSQLQIDAETITDIQNAVNSGKEVTVSKSDITYNDWTGHGYIVIDPNTGAGAYMIAGGMSGALILGTFLFILAFIFVILAIACVALTGPAALICIGIMIYHAFLAFIAAIATFYGKEKLDEFMDCIALVTADNVATEAFQKIIIQFPPLILLILAFFSGRSVGICIESTFYDWEKIYE